MSNPNSLQCILQIYLREAATRNTNPDWVVDCVDAWWDRLPSGPWRNENHQVDNALPRFKEIWISVGRSWFVCRNQEANIHRSGRRNRGITGSLITADTAPAAPVGPPIHRAISDREIHPVFLFWVSDRVGRISDALPLRSAR